MFLLFVVLGIGLLATCIGAGTGTIGLVILGLPLVLSSGTYLTVYVKTRGMISPITYLRNLFNLMFRRPLDNVQVVRIGNTVILIRPIYVGKRKILSIGDLENVEPSPLTHYYDYKRLDMARCRIGKQIIVKLFDMTFLLDYALFNIYYLADDGNSVRTILEQFVNTLTIVGQVVDKRILIHELINMIEKAITLLSQHLLIVPPLPNTITRTIHVEYVDSNIEWEWLWDRFENPNLKNKIKIGKDSILKTNATYVSNISEFIYLYETPNDKHIGIDYLTHMVLQYCKQPRTLPQVESFVTRHGVDSGVVCYYIKHLLTNNLIEIVEGE